MKNPPELTGKHFCIKCRKEVPKKEYFKNQLRCKECNQLPDHWEDKKCDKCPHVPHEGKCNALTAHDGKGNITHYCGCEG